MRMALTAKRMKKYMQMVSKAARRGRTVKGYCSLEELYLKEGKVFSKEPLSRTEECELLDLLAGSRDLFQMRQCYMNASKLAIGCDCLKFCEGLTGCVIPITHAWVSFKGRPIDVTWIRHKEDTPTNDLELLMSRIRHNIKTWTYIGVEISREKLHEVIFSRTLWGSVRELEIVPQNLS